MRDMELVRSILTALAERENQYERFDNSGGLEIKGYPDHQVHHHLQLMYQAELITCAYLGKERWNFGDSIIAATPTWKGYDFLAASQNEGAWADLKEKFSDNLSEIPFDTLMFALKAYAKYQVKEKLGVDL